MSRAAEYEVAGNSWKMPSPGLTTCWFSKSLDWSNNSFKIAMTEVDMENALTADGNYQSSSSMPLDKAFYWATQDIMFFCAVDEPCVSLGLL